MHLCSQNFAIFIYYSRTLLRVNLPILSSLCIFISRKRCKLVSSVHVASTLIDRTSRARTRRKLGIHMRTHNPENRVLIARRKIRYLFCVHTKGMTLSMHGKMDRILFPFPSAPIRVAVEYPREIRSRNEGRSLRRSPIRA